MSSASPITVVVTRTVRAGCEAAFEAALQEFIRRSTAGDGQLGVHVVRPAPGSGSREYGILRRFANAAARDAFYASPVFGDWQRTVAPLSDGPSRREDVCGMEAWFTAPGRAFVPPPRWKMAAITFLGVYPMSLLLPWLLRPLVGGWPRWAAALAVAGSMVTILTWSVMPALARLFHPWLRAPEPPRPRIDADRG